MDYESLCAMPDDCLARRDVAELNLLAAQGLPGAHNLDVANCLRRIDDWTEAVDKGIKRHWKRRAKGECAHLMGNQFRVLVMVTILQRDLGVHYNPKSMTGEYDATDARDHFIHGPLAGHGGTCSSLPILYLAIGRRLGFPLRLVQTKEHLFVRWESDDERFNIESTARGFIPYDDARYRCSPKPISDAEIERWGYLSNLSPRQELACHIFQRGRCWADSLEFEEAVKALYFAQHLDSYYLGNWIATSMQLAIHSRMESMDRSLPCATAVERAAHRPRTSEEAWGIDAAKEDLLRIFRVRGRMKLDNQDSFFSQLGKESTNV